MSQQTPASDRASSADVSRQVVQAIVGNSGSGVGRGTSSRSNNVGVSNGASRPPRQQPPSSSCRSRSHSPHFNVHRRQQPQPQLQHQPPVKTVSFSSISTPHLNDDGDDDDMVDSRVRRWRRRDASNDNSSSRSRSPPPSSLSPMRQRGSLRSGETTASGDSSVSSSLHTSQVHFSALNPNPQLLLDQFSSSSADRHRVSFGNNNPNPSSSSHRSGLSSPSIEPALSPPASRRGSERGQHIQFDLDNNTMNTITEAAARLTRLTTPAITPTTNASTAASASTTHVVERRPSGSKVVHFSAMLKRNSGASGTDAPPRVSTTDDDDDDRDPVSPPSSSSAVHFNVPPEDEDDVPLNTPTTTAEAERVADRLRRLIRRAESAGDVTLESAFAHFDSRNTGAIDPRGLREGLLRLNFDFSERESASLLKCLGGDETSGTISLLRFYRAMGRRSPPPQTPNDDDGSASRASRGDAAALGHSAAARAHDAATRLRGLLSANDGSLEDTFRALDPAGTGHISAADFRTGLRRWGTTFEDGARRLNEEEEDSLCQELVALFDTNQDGLVSLLDFYRFMGRKSPPPSRTSGGEDDG